MVNHSKADQKPIKVAIIAAQKPALFELACAVELFALPRPEYSPWYRAEVVSFFDSPLACDGGLSLQLKKVRSLKRYDMLLVPSWPSQGGIVSSVMLGQLRRFSDEGKRLVSFCSGAFLLAEAGLLDGKKASTHWRYAEILQQRFPKLHYMGDVLYTEDDNVFCSAGSAAGLDLGIELIRRDFGVTIANQVAKRLLLSAHRQGGQHQFVEAPVPKKPNELSQALDWALENLHTTFDVNDFAAQANMSRRSFDRKFRAGLNQTPKQWLIEQRLQLARQLLESGEQGIEWVAQHSGFDNAISLRHHFRQNLGVSPQQYRRQFFS